MTRLTLMPYLTASTGAWEPSDWLARVDDGDFAPVDAVVDAVVDAWDYHTTLTLQENTAVDVDEVRRACALSDRAGVAYVVLAECATVGRRDIAFGEELPAGGKVTIDSQFTAAPGIFAGALQLTRQIVLTAPDDSRPPSPTTPGAVLLAESSPTDIALEDGTGRFPTEIADFTQLAHPEAVWKLSVDWDAPDEAFTSAVRLSLNSANPAIQRLLTDPDSPDAARVADVITWDWQRQVLAGAAARADDFGRDDFADDSLGGVVHRMVRDRLRLGSVGQLRDRLMIDDTFEELVQARTRLFRD